MSTPKPEDEAGLEEGTPEFEAVAIEAAESAKTEPFMKGKFSLYETPGGGIHLSYWTEQHGEGHRDFPGRLVKMMSTGRLSKMFGA